MAATLPCATLYVSNINEKIKQREVRRSLYEFFGCYGPIIDLISYRSEKMRGQAFIVFRDIASASNALRATMSFNFYGKPLKVAYAKNKSIATKQLERWVVKNVKQMPYLSALLPERKRRLDQDDEEEAEDNNNNNREDEKTPQGGEKRVKVAAADSNTANGSISASSESSAPANKVLFLENLPAEANETMLSLLFEQYPGFREVRIVPGKVGIAFVEYETDGQAAVARDVLNSFKLTPTHSMKVSFAKSGSGGSSSD